GREDEVQNDRPTVAHLVRQRDDFAVVAHETHGRDRIFADRPDRTARLRSRRGERVVRSVRGPAGSKHEECYAGKCSQADENAVAPAHGCRRGAPRAGAKVRLGLWDHGSGFPFASAGYCLGAIYINPTRMAEWVRLTVKAQSSRPRRPGPCRRGRGNARRNPPWM